MKFTPERSGSFFIPHENVESWPVVTLDDEQWFVAPIPFAPVAIGDAAEVCSRYSCMIPTPALVDAIAAAADIRVEPHWRKTNGTPAQMASEKAYADQERINLERILEVGCPGIDALVYGTHKDVVLNADGKAGLYGWITKSGETLQDEFYGHGGFWIDYSQGVRPVRKKEKSDE